MVAYKRALESLVKAGAFDSTGATRKGMLEVVEQALAWGSREHADRHREGVDLLSGRDRDRGPHAEGSKNRPPNRGSGSRSSHEKEAVGLYVSEHLLQGEWPALGAASTPGLPRSQRRRDGDHVSPSAG